MQNLTWQINPALSIQDFPEMQQLTFGQLSPYAFSVNDSYKELKLICLQLKSKAHFLYEDFKKLAIENQFLGPDLFSDFKKLKIIIPYLEKTNRYSRHHLYYSYNGISFDAQKTLSEKTVLLIGTGGIGSTCAMILAAAGIGKLILTDGDRLEESNLTRTTLFNNSDVGLPKVVAAKKRLLEKNPQVAVETIQVMFELENFEEFRKPFQDADFIILSGDSGLETHQLSYELSKKYNKPLLNAGYIETFGVVGPVTIGEHKKRESDLIFNPATRELNTDLAAASYGPLNTLVSSMAVNEVIRYFLNLSLATINKRLLIDSANYEIKQESWV